ncbi:MULTISPECIES: sugar kinase [unclassified Pseudomonas]|uniref:sugar kinase n=1 Tax=unclassified Pseudomonas TaxID=196821 RepID=UPI00224B63FF|nr:MULTISPECIES: sugar kinase [unclassified Pseudomonas]MCX2891312.1 sugar kinase [Pseudomonas sp. DCB_BI]MDH4549441.1 sugar kinase [Pseudomonas sp. BN607]
MHDHDVLCFGETMAMFVAEHAGDLASVGQFAKRIAGADSNVAIGLARLGFKVRWLSRVGDDSLGRFVLDSLRREGLDCSAVEVDCNFPTGFQLKARCDDGSDPTVEYFRRGSAASWLSPTMIQPGLLQSRHLHATGIPPALSQGCRALSHELLDAMRAAGRSISFDPNLRPSLWPDQSRMVREINALAFKADWVLPGLEEGRLLTGQHSPADIAAFYLDQGVELVVIKLGEAGAYFRSAKGEGQVAPVLVSRVVDTVGAGDAFAVGVLSALLEGCPVAQAVARGNWCGSRAVQSRGDMEGLPLRHELEAYDLRRSA